MDAHSHVKSADALLGERGRALYAVWRQRAGERLAPSRADLTPSVLRRLLPWIWTADVIDGGRDFQLRIAGDRCVQFLGDHVTRKRLSQLPQSAFFIVLKTLFAHCSSEARPLALGPMPSAHVGKEHWEIEIAALPLSDDGKTVSGLIGVIELWSPGAAPA